MKSNLLILGFIIIVSLCGCASTTAKKTVAYTYSVETGDNIVVELDASGNYGLSSEIPFEISHNGEVISHGIFIYSDYYSEYIETVKNDSNAIIIDSGENDSCEYLMWNYKGEEFNYVMKIKGTDTGLLLGNNVSEESAKECFQRLKITVKH